MSKVRVGVLRGGPSSEYDVSLKTGSAVLNNLPDHYTPVDLLITQDGLWHWQGMPIAPKDITRRVDVVFNALHGEYGEDGQVQNILDSLGIPYTGSGRFSSALAINKYLTKQALAKEGIKTPAYFLIKASDNVEDSARTIFNKLSPPWIIKPADRGSSVGLFLVKHFAQLVEGLESARKHSELILVEEFIFGQEATCGVIDNFRGTGLYSLPVIEIRTPANKTIFDYEAKYSGLTEEICPACFTSGIKKEIESLAQQVHKILGLRHYSRSDFMISKRGQVYFLEANTLPGLTEESLLPKSLAAVGSNHSQFIDHILGLALAGK